MLGTGLVDAAAKPAAHPGATEEHMHSAHPHEIEEAENLLESYLMRARPFEYIVKICHGQSGLFSTDASHLSSTCTGRMDHGDSPSNCVLALNYLNMIRGVAQFEYMYNQLVILKEHIDDVEDLINIDLDSRCK